MAYLSNRSHHSLCFLTAHFPILLITLGFAIVLIPKIGSSSFSLSSLSLPLTLSFTIVTRASLLVPPLGNHSWLTHTRLLTSSFRLLGLRIWLSSFYSWLHLSSSMVLGLHSFRLVYPPCWELCLWGSSLSTFSIVFGHILFH